MCSRYESLDQNEAARIYRAKLKIPKAIEIKSLIFPGYTAPVVLEGAKERVVEARFWGFVARFPGKKDPKKMIEKIMQNAVSETVDEKRTFKSAWMKSQRCIIPAAHFMEPIEKKFTAIVEPGHEVLSIAGIWGETTYKEEKREAFTMLTSEPNKWMEKFHDRMPVILHPDDVEEWLSPDTPPDQAMKLCRPYSGTLKFK